LNGALQIIDGGLILALCAAHCGEALQNFVALRIFGRGLLNQLAGLFIEVETGLIFVVHIAGACRGERLFNAGLGNTGRGGARRGLLSGNAANQGKKNKNTHASYVVLIY
jgi:hypothetical protein